MNQYMVIPSNFKSGCFVKEKSFFDFQKTQPSPGNPDWWTHWVPVEAISIEAARELAYRMGVEKYGVGLNKSV